jgi:hypothetical protein
LPFPILRCTTYFWSFNSEAEKEDDEAAQRDLIGHRLREDVVRTQISNL